jgi:hypothetical protein
VGAAKRVEHAPIRQAIKTGQPLERPKRIGRGDLFRVSDTEPAVIIANSLADPRQVTQRAIRREFRHRTTPPRRPDNPRVQHRNRAADTSTATDQPSPDLFNPPYKSPGIPQGSRYLRRSPSQSPRLPAPTRKSLGKMWATPIQAAGAPERRQCMRGRHRCRPP